MKIKKVEKDGRKFNEQVHYNEKNKIYVMLWISVSSKDEKVIPMIQHVGPILCDYMLDNYTIFFTDNKKKASGTIIKILYKNINILTEKLKIEPDKYLVSLIAVGLDEEKKKYFTIHFGNGMIIKKRKSGDHVISYPDTKASGCDIRSLSFIKNIKIRSAIFKKEDEAIIIKNSEEKIMIMLERKQEEEYG